MRKATRSGSNCKRWGLFSGADGDHVRGAPIWVEITAGGNPGLSHYGFAGGTADQQPVAAQIAPPRQVPTAIMFAAAYACLVPALSLALGFQCAF